MKKVLAIVVISMALLQAKAQTNKGNTAPQKIETTGKKPTSTTTTTSTTVETDSKPTDTGKPVNTGKEEKPVKETKEGKQSTHANEHSKTKSNNGNHYGQIKNADKGKGRKK